jgi:hypothetical protein
MSKEDDEEMPEWVDEAAPEWGNAGKSEDANSDASWMMMRMTSHFLNIVQPKLEERVSKYAHEYHTEAMKSDDFTIRQHDMYSMRIMFLYLNRTWRHFRVNIQKLSSLIH